MNNVVHAARSSPLTSVAGLAVLVTHLFSVVSQHAPLDPSVVSMALGLLVARDGNESST